MRLENVMKVLEVLDKPKPLKSVVEETKLSKPTVCSILQILEKHGLVVSIKRGKEKLYGLTHDGFTIRFLWSLLKPHLRFLERRS